MRLPGNPLFTNIVIRNDRLPERIYVRRTDDISQLTAAFVKN